MTHPRISIVTPSFNQGQYLEETICSVLDQNYPNLEYIIIDGGSTDRSVEIIKKYEKHLKYWISEKDHGQSDAINKGLSHVTGELFNWLNSDDYFEPGSFNKVSQAYLNNRSKKVFCFKLSHLSGNKKSVFDKLNDPGNALQCWVDPVINQQSTFYTGEAISFLGNLDKRFHYAMDYEWWLRFLFQFGTEAVYTSSETIAVFRMHAESKTHHSHKRFIDEIATQIASLARKSDWPEYYELLQVRFSVDQSYVFPGLAIEDKVMIKRMAAYFLLKWSRRIENKKDFLFTKQLVSVIDKGNFQLNHDERQWLEQLHSISHIPNWFFYRAKQRLAL